MSQLDKLIDKLQQKQDILIETGKEPMLRTSAGPRVMVNQLLTTPQIQSLLTEIAPPEHKPSIAQKKQTTFEYLFNGKSHSIMFMAQADSVRCVISLTEEKDPAPASTASSVEPEVAAEPEPDSPPSTDEPEINALFRKMVKMGASDLHMTSGHKPMIRESGDMVELEGYPVISMDRMKKLLSTIIPKHNMNQFEEVHDTDFAYEIPGLARFRANIFLDRFGIGAVFRQIPVEIVSAEKLGLSKEVLDLCFLSKGLVLVTGPTGSGKSTTLCALIDYINRHRKDHIITIEDPIEFVHSKKSCLINQREVHIHTKSFSNALRAALREDPDIILVGEMRDLETISIAIETAETGHLVFGTLHTTTAASTVDRIIDQFPADRQAQIRTMLSSSLKGVIAQTLCKKTTKGRAAAMEVLFVTSAVSNLIREGKIFQIPSVIQTSKGSGMVLLNDALFKLVNEKTVSPEEAYMKAIDKTNFLSMLKAKGITVNLTGMADQ